MKVYAIISVVLLLAMLFVPLFSLLGETYEAGAVSSPIQAVSANVKKKNKTESEKNSAGIRVMRTSSGKIENVDMKEYVIGCVCGEMIPSYEKEALKAQAVVSYTYALYLLENPCSENADVTDSPAKHQSYKSREEVKEKWGDKYEASIRNVEEAVEEVAGQYITYKGEIIKPAYHAMSSGRTNSALAVWGSDVPYLQSVTSDADTLSPKFISTFDFSKEEMINTLSSLSGEQIDEIRIGSSLTNAGGYVEKIEISDKVFSGEKLRSAFSLRSSSFTLSEKDGIYTFTCRGYGHGVGMSQNGAQEMAKSGSTYDEILKHYYTGIEIKT